MIAKSFNENSYKTKLSDAEKRRSDLIIYIFLATLVLVISVITAI
ncbi:hypothetical protein ADIARSV_1656 [Arcticibacter svalbardensis MN12-7]|uniref:Uncharacterized protein n=1 Tax=Arcticibacter svalbardensis MN12-7 TaxID=1150600 RepID=R9GU36_9SPHI|nr:hypothetical protein [Arcticibacter svalbardensis]EOR95168.1 hypothetical protein ADIARSV_1656 [Arcticibacter svalbardensis MN12-7]